MNIFQKIYYFFVGKKKNSKLIFTEKMVHKAKTNMIDPSIFKESEKERKKMISEKKAVKSLVSDKNKKELDKLKKLI